MCQSMVNIQSPTAEIRRGKKRKKERRRTNHSMKIYMVSLFHRATIIIQWTNMFGDATAKSLCPTLCSIKVSWKNRLLEVDGARTPAPHSRRGQWKIYQFLRSLYAIARPSVCRLSVVCNVRAPYSGVQIFGNISTILGALAIRWHPLKFSRRSSEGNPSAGGVKHKSGSQV